MDLLQTIVLSHFYNFLTAFKLDIFLKGSKNHPCDLEVSKFKYILGSWLSNFLSGLIC